jgi:aspartate racemase
MKKVGLIGGVGPQATAYIYQKLIEVSQSAYNARNNDDYPDVIFASVPVPDFISSKAKLEVAEEMLINTAIGLERAGCDALFIGSSTVHILLDKLQAKTTIPFISMVELVAQRCSDLGYERVALLGTPVLLGSGLYDRALSAQGINLIKPDAAQIEVCDEIIRLILAGKSVDPVKPSYVGVISSMFDHKAEAVILGCTELPLVLDYEVLGDRILSSDKILAEGIAKFCYQA